MSSRILRSLLLLGAVNVSMLASAQSFQQPFHLTSTDVAVTYGASFAKPVQSNSNFWMYGGGVNAGFTFYRGLGVAASFVGEHSANITPGVGITKLSYAAGPRYTYELNRRGEQSRTSIFGESLFGSTHAYDSIFPASSGIKSSADAFTMQVGGGLNMEVARQFSVRLPEVHYVRTTLPNGGSNTQNDIRLAVGVSYRIRKR